MKISRLLSVKRKLWPDHVYIYFLLYYKQWSHWSSIQLLLKISVSNWRCFNENDCVNQLFLICGLGVSLFHDESPEHLPYYSNSDSFTMPCQNLNWWNYVALCIQHNSGQVKLHWDLIMFKLSVCLCVFPEYVWWH